MAPRTNPPYRMVVHGGAWSIPPKEFEAHRNGCTRALRRGEGVLADGGRAVDAVEAAVSCLEDDPAFDAGRGSVLNELGFVEMDAAIMDGQDLSVGSVAAVREVRNPIRLARRVLETDHVMLVGDGAMRFAAQQGLKFEPAAWFVVDRERDRWETPSDVGHQSASAPHGTVGAVALDRAGDLAAATSTGGLPAKPMGRVGDSPIVGAGIYAQNGRAAVSATGLGEAFVRLVWAFRAAQMLDAASNPQRACDRAMSYLAPLAAWGGIVMLAPNGDVGLAANTSAMAFAHRDRYGRIVSGPFDRPRRSADASGSSAYDSCDG